MEDWPDRMKLFAVLASAKVLLETVSRNDAWSIESANESLKVISQAIAFFFNPEVNAYPENISMQFAPSGTLQKISIANGWDQVFLKLAEQFNKYINCLNKE